MQLGKKIKKIRTSRGLTQSELCGDRITRNMLSAIESGKASPSLDTLIYIAEGLGVSAALLLSDGEVGNLIEKKELTERARNLLREERYDECLSEIMLSSIPFDDEFNYVSALCTFKIGYRLFCGGSLTSAQEYFTKCIGYSNLTVYDTGIFTTSALLYIAVCKNVNAPLLELSEEDYINNLAMLTDIDFYQYLTKNSLFPFKNEQYRLHLLAKQKIKERYYNDALQLLTEIESTKSSYPPNAFLMFGVYSDIENCYRQLFDFESAYRYSSKRISMLEGFSS